MSATDKFDLRFAEMPLVAIIRGVKPDEAVAIGEALVEAGIRIIEVPLNSPDPLRSIERLSKRLGEDALIGAGTVLSVEDVLRVKDVGGELVVSPNMNPAVIRAAVEAGMVSSPGIFTPSEAFAALDNGAHALKLFPAEAASPEVVKALRAVLPKETRLLVVGGVGVDEMDSWLAAGRQWIRAWLGCLQARARRCRDIGEGACLCRCGEALMRPLNIAIIGFGKIAADQHVPAIAGNPRLELAATVSRSGAGPKPSSPATAICSATSGIWMRSR